MPKTIELVVKLKIPDTTAITALQTLHEMGFSKIKDLKRADYYKFSIDGDAEKFREKISKTDIIVNANKHSFDFKVNDDGSAKVKVSNFDDDNSGLLATLRNRLGFKELKKISKYTMWNVYSDTSKSETAKLAEKAAKDLLVNAHYQDYEVS
jgi:phosphoribosylformylglycinamidine (FGAM) synthase PurS component